MVKNNGLTFYSKSNRKHKSNFWSLIKLFFIAVFYIALFEFYSYKNLIRDFKTSFNEYNFSDANLLLISNENLNPFKSIFLKKDLTDYFNEKINKLSSNSDNCFNEQTSINIINEIKRYSDYTNIDNQVFFNSDNSFQNAVHLFEYQKYIQAYNIFSKIKSTDINYTSSIEYIKECKEHITQEVLSEVTELCNDECYSEALDLIDSVNYIIGDNESIISKIEEIKVYQSDYSYKDDAAQVSSTSINSKINLSNINNLSLSSNTKYLIQVDLHNQRTNIYKGSKNSWNLLKSFTCSSGVKGEETPAGSYTVKTKGKWFFSNSYKQGGKYWVQFYGNYLFHSLPLDETKDKILDYTLGKPASHGCIRLREIDSKWIYDNIPEGSKVIIQ